MTIEKDNQIAVLEGFLYIVWLLYVVWIILVAVNSEGRCYDPSISDPTGIISIGKTIVFLNIASYILFLFTEGESKSAWFFFIVVLFLLPASISISIRCYL
tara:strand:+ start:424 stop:726 length:303 start_codon:yes stop_codon:yes gene_type:complete